MWIQELPADYYDRTSFCYGNVMLWNNGKVYVMDNHKSAAWCWFQKCNKKASYNFMHIDRHRDMLECYMEEDIDLLKDNLEFTFDKFSEFKCAKRDFKLFRWDNFIKVTYKLFPRWFTTNLLLTQKEGDLGRIKMRIYEEDPIFMLFYISQYLLEPSDALYNLQDGAARLKWIVSLDLDAFFSEDYDHVRIFSDDYIRKVAQLLQKAMGNIQVLTIAISPDCLPGRGMKEKWNSGFEVLKIFSEEISALKGFPFPG